MPFTFGSFVVSNPDALSAVLAFDQTCLGNYDFGGRSAPDSVDTGDIGRLIGSQMVGFAQSVAASLVSEGAKAPWAAVPIDARIEDAAPNSTLYVAAGALMDYFQGITGVGPAIATKLLGMKRPALFPVIDDRILQLYARAAEAQGSLSHPTIASIRDDVVNLADVAALEQLRATLMADGSIQALRLGQLPGIRLRDIVIWQRWTLLGIGARPPAAPSWPGKIPL